MKVVIATDSFKGSLSSMQADNAACAGIKRVCDAANNSFYIDSGRGFM